MIYFPIVKRGRDSHGTPFQSVNVANLTSFWKKKIPLTEGAFPGISTGWELYDWHSVSHFSHQLFPTGGNVWVCGAAGGHPVELNYVCVFTVGFHFS